MQTPIFHRHRDGSSHISHCYPERGPVPVRLAWQPPCPVTPEERRGRTVLSVSGSALALATAAFWATMLLAPPVSEATAGLRFPEPCAAMEHHVRPWFEREIARRARVAAAPGQSDFNALLLDYRAAQAQCRAGRGRAADQAIASLDRRIVALSDAAVLPEDE
ncbi:MULTISPECIES: hypothetical protein [unclassified Methylobacterium]|uniref:hypothetical protein n=1 Tax=unclassified Methylobacterium TaxID=2615210 RepID=UPI001F3FC358|nr:MULTISPECIES: hypothetical protein [Methylobacterium]WFT78921.1 hypothetical protein QA634_27270 [Methylobacterium nodulans]